MTRLKKPLPKFINEEEEAEYWDNHSVLEHFDENDFEPLQIKNAKDHPITIRLDSESRLILEQISKTQKVGPSTLARMIIVSALKQWQKKQPLSLPCGDVTEAFRQTIPDGIRQEVKKLLHESETGNLYVLSETQLERLSKTMVRDALEGAGYTTKSADNPPKKQKRNSGVTKNQP